MSHSSKPTRGEAYELLVLDAENTVALLFFRLDLPSLVTYPELEGASEANLIETQCFVITIQQLLSGQNASRGFKENESQLLLFENNSFFSFSKH